MAKKKNLKMYRVRIDKPSALEMLVIAPNKKAVYKKKIILGLPKGTKVRIDRKKIKEGIIASWSKVVNNVSEELHDSLPNNEKETDYSMGLDSSANE